MKVNHVLSLSIVFACQQILLGAEMSPTLNDALTNDASKAHTAIIVMQKDRDVHALSHAMRDAYLPRIKIEAIRSLEGIDSDEASNSLINELEHQCKISVPGGTGTQIHHAKFIGELIGSLSRKLVIAAPENQSKDNVADFIQKCRAKAASNNGATSAK